jgi:hypothetical protein
VEGTPGWEEEGHSNGAKAARQAWNVRKRVLREGLAVRREGGDARMDVPQSRQRRR